MDKDQKVLAKEATKMVNRESSVLKDKKKVKCRPKEWFKRI